VHPQQKEVSPQGSNNNEPSGMNRVLDKIIDFFGFLGILLMVIMLAVVTLDICARYFFNKPLLWTHEVTEYAMVWVTFLGAAWVLRKEGHVIVDIVPSRLNAKAKAMLFTVVSIIGIPMMFLFIWYGTKVTIDLYLTKRMLSTVMMPPAWILYTIIPLGSLLLMLQFLRRAAKHYKEWQSYGKST
jgi:TRAP-type C4-dicarboxylate transport system permease small subunit